MPKCLAVVVLAVLPSVATGDGPESRPVEVPAPARAAAAGIPWEQWSDHAFERARREGRFVLLDLGAVWCHWCHVMEETTYQDPAVVDLIRARYVPVRVDQDARPDLASRYEDYGWPATIVFDAQGLELVKFRGYVAPARMAALLQGVIDDPTPGPSVRPRPALAATDAAGLGMELASELRDLLSSRYDREHAGWGFIHKYLDWDSVEYCLVRASEGDAEAARMARETLDAQTRLIDPVWGGVYQYSDGGTWESPHFEKIMSMQAENLRVYAQAYVLWRDPRYLRAARDIHRYLGTFLRSPEGAFYASQDADLVPGEHAAAYFALGDAERRRIGLPRVDKRLFARENGWATAGLVALYAATGDEAVLAEALQVARWILDNRSLPGGGFGHDEHDPAGPFLADTLAAGRAFLALYGATGDQAWLGRAEAAAAFIASRFRREGGPGFVTAEAAGPGASPVVQREENVGMARFAALLARHTGRDAHRELAEQAMRFLAMPEVARRFNTGGVLLADRELRARPDGPSAGPVCR